MYTAKERLYLTLDKKRVVKEDSAEAAFLLVREGGQLTDEDAKKYGLLKGESAKDEAVETKAVESKDVQNKAITSKATKRK